MHIFTVYDEILSPSQKECYYENRVGQTFLSLIRFAENISSIYSNIYLIILIIYQKY